MRNLLATDDFRKGLGRPWEILSLGVFHHDGATVVGDERASVCVDHDQSRNARHLKLAGEVILGVHARGKVTGRRSMQASYLRQQCKLAMIRLAGYIYTFLSLLP